MRPRLITYRVAEPGFRAVWNRYDYRPQGGKRYAIGAAVVVGRWCLSLQWSRPGSPEQS